MLTVVRGIPSSFTWTDSIHSNYAKTLLKSYSIIKTLNMERLLIQLSKEKQRMEWPSCKKVLAIINTTRKFNRYYP